MSNRWMDPEFRPLIKEPRPVLHDAVAAREAIAKSREIIDFAAHGLDVFDISVPPSSEESGEVPLRVYCPKAAHGPLPALLYLHGGGFFCGDLFSEQWQCGQYASQVGCVVVCVDYRLAPENPYPAALFDCYRALEFLHAQSEALHIDRSKIAVGGSSAGANLAAAIALLARDRNGPKVFFQMLLIPALDDRLDSPSAREFTDAPDFAAPEAQTMWRWYLGADHGEISSYAAPIRSIDLSYLPPAYVLCAGLDPLRDDGLRYAQRLIAAGIDVELHLVPSIPHGFASVATASTSKRLLEEQIHALTQAFHVWSGTSSH